jgi:hypothetical protein
MRFEFGRSRASNWSREDAGDEDDAQRRERECAVRIDWSAKPQTGKLAAQREWLSGFLTRGGVDPKVNHFTIRLPCR